MRACEREPNRHPSNVSLWRLALSTAAAILAAPALAQTGGLPDYGHQWAVVTGINAPTQTVPTPLIPQGRTIQSVNDDYRIMTREVTVAEWYEFVRAFAPHVPTVGVSPNSSEFLGSNGISWSGTSGGVPQYTLHIGVDQRPATPGWRFAARFANWLHNGKPVAATSPGGVVPLSAFSSGAYDASTFGQTFVDPPGINVLTDQTARSEGARFWIPNMHEWVKAMYWDPNKNGPGQAGYWQYPITSDTAPIPGDPALGGQTNTGPFPQGHTRPLDVGSYANVMSPWGLLDGSGGATEWLEDVSNPLFPQSRLIAGSRFTSTLSPEITDQLGQFATQSPFFSGVGIRLASMVIPSPGVAFTLGSLFLGWGGRRSRYATPMLAAAALLSSTTSAQTGGLPNHGHQWSVVTGINAPTQTVPTPLIPQGRTIQSVNDDYRIMTREVTNGEWLEFVRAFAPHLSTTGVSDIDTQFTGGSLERVGYANGVPQYAVLSGRANRPTLPGWRFAARFANWLHNGKPVASTSPGGPGSVVPLSAFSSGAYDTSTFGGIVVPPGVPVATDQSTRSEGARFWIPNMHEWVKAMYWDPNKSGPGQAGYWNYPITSDIAPIPGDPALGGQTNTGTFPQGHTRPLDVGSYANVMSPWGLLDGSGGASEMLEEWDIPAFPGERLTGGSDFLLTHGEPAQTDRLARFGRVSVVGSGAGIRLASMVVPGPGVALALGSLFLGWGGRRSRYAHHEGVGGFRP